MPHAVSPLDALTSSAWRARYAPASGTPHHGRPHPRQLTQAHYYEPGLPFIHTALNSLITDAARTAFLREFVHLVVTGTREGCASTMGRRFPVGAGLAAQRVARPQDLTPGIYYLPDPTGAGSGALARLSAWALQGRGRLLFTQDASDRMIWYRPRWNDPTCHLFRVAYYLAYPVR